jgi:hypothetical protein
MFISALTFLATNFGEQFFRDHVEGLGDLSVAIPAETFGCLIEELVVSEGEGGVEDGNVQDASGTFSIRTPTERSNMGA